MAPNSILGCQVFPDGWRPGACFIIDDDVAGHEFTPTHTATVSISWSEAPNGERRIEFASDDPDAQAVLMDLLKPTAGEGSNRQDATD